MFITRTNVIKNLSPTVVTGVNPDFDPSGITDPDFSTLYRSTDNTRLFFDFGAVNGINYVSFSGINIQGNQDFTSRCFVADGGNIIASTYINRNHSVVIDFETRDFTNLRLGLINPSGNANPIVRYCSAGVGFYVPNGGETAGYNRQFLNRNIINRTTINNDSAPIAQLRKRVAGAGTLNIPNMTAEFSEGEWQQFLDFAYENHFLIREQDPTPTQDGTELVTRNNSAYLCYDPGKSTPKAHPDTRRLNNISFPFKVYNGL